MAKNLKLNIKNTQIAKAINLGGLKDKLAKKKEEEEEKKASSAKVHAKPTKTTPEVTEEIKEEHAPRKARSKSAFAEHGAEEMAKTHEPSQEYVEEASTSRYQEAEEELIEPEHKASHDVLAEEIPTTQPATEEKKHHEIIEEVKPHVAPPASRPTYPHEKLGPTGRHVKDLIPPPRPPMPRQPPRHEPRHPPAQRFEKKPFMPPVPPKPEVEAGERIRPTDKLKAKKGFGEAETEEERKGKAKVKEFRDIKPTRKVEEKKTFDSRDRQGLRDTESDEFSYRRRKKGKFHRPQQEDVTIRPTELKIRLPITIKDLALEMKLKSSELVSKLFLQGIVATLNDFITDETTVQLLGHEFGCEITVDTTEEKRIRITDKTIKEEVKEVSPDDLMIRPPVVTFMGHVDHGKTSLIDAIRKTNRAAGEAGAITQHIGAFKCHTAVGDIAILDTPGHEAFSAMRARGADVTDIVVLVVAGDEGIRQQTLEAIQHAKAANVIIVVAINKSDKPNFNPEIVYRQLADADLLPETWGGQTITVNCSAVTGQGIKELLEMLAIQAEVLELKASAKMRARGTVLESEMHKGLGSVATVLVQNGTLRRNDSLVFGHQWGRVKTMHDEYGKELEEAGPSTPVEITGLSGLPEAGQEFIVVKSEKEAQDIANTRLMDFRKTNLTLSKRQTMESLFQEASAPNKKMLNVVVRADVQGSLEALKVALKKIESDKIDLSIIFAGVGEVTESDVQLASASKAVIIGFHTKIESHAETLVKRLGVTVRLHDIIYHALDDVKLLMKGMLDKIAQENDRGKASVKALFKSTHIGTIAGCIVTDGSIARSSHIRVMRDGAVVWKGPIASLKRVKEDVREVTKGLECGIHLQNFNDLKEGDVLEAYDITYIAQEL